MIRARADRLFDRYRRTGDPGALAALFDCTASELWRVATYLTRDPHVVEDAVQTTFLKAIEDAGRWDRRLPVLSWLIGILTNQVRTQQRRQQRAGTPLPADPVSPAHDPAVDAVSRELHAEVARAMQRLAPPYRTVLEQHLVLGLAPAEIAARLGLAGGTVRVRLHRGLDRLRRLLPPGFAAAGLVAVGVPAERLAAMRHVVVQRASDVGATLAAGAGLSLLAGFGGLAMQKTMMGLAAAALALAGWFVCDPFAASAAREELAPLPGASIATGPRATPGASAGVAPAASTTRAAVASRNALASGSLRVRVVRSDTAAAVVGAHIRWQGRHPTSGIADARGEWVVEDDAGPGTVSLSLGASKRCDLVAGGETLVVFELSPRVRVDLRVVDGARRPIAGARVFGTVREGHLRWELIGQTDRDGAFRYAWLFARAEVWAEADGMVPSEVVGAEARDEPWRRTVVLRERAARVAGVVIDHGGAPLAGARVAIQASDPRRHYPPMPILVRTDDHGRFASASVSPGPVHAFALGGSGDPAFANAGRVGRAVGKAVLGQTVELVIRLDAGARVVVRASGDLARGDGGAEVAAVIAEPALEGNLANELPGARCRLDAGGGGALGPLMPGRYRLLLRAGNRECVHTVDLADGETLPWQPALDRALPLHLRCLDAEGKPLAHWLVHVARSDQAHLTLSVETDADGRCTVEDLADAPCAVSVFQPGRWEAAVRFADVRPGTGERTLRVGGDDVETPGGGGDEQPPRDGWLTTAA